MDVKQCIVMDSGGESDNSNEGRKHAVKQNPEKETYMSGLQLDFTCETKDLSILSDYITKIKTDNKSITEAIDPSSITINNVIAFEPPDHVVAVEEPEKEREDETVNVESEKESVPAKETPTDIIGTWYDPTGYSTASMTFNADGTGIQDWGFGSRGPTPMTYSVGSGSVSIKLTNSSFTLKISNGKLIDADGSVYVRR